MVLSPTIAPKRAARFSSSPGIPAPGSVNRLFVIRSGAPYPRLERWAGRLPFLAPVVAAVTRDSIARRNPRDAAYMDRLLADTFPDFAPDRVVRLGDDEARTVDWSAPDEIVLVWADANGTGWGPIERVVLARKRASSRVLVVNGRRRRFVLDAAERRAFRRRRFLEKTLAGEFAFAVVFAVLTPCLWLSDVIRGRR